MQARVCVSGVWCAAALWPVPPGGQRRPRPSLEGGTPTASILLIDDEPELRATVRELLEAAGYTILEASDGQAGGGWGQEDPLDLVLPGLLMPGPQSFQTIPALLTVRPSLKIIAITGAAPMDGRDLHTFAQQVGADQTLPKPVRIAVLHAAIQTLLGESEGGALS